MAEVLDASEDRPVWASRLRAERAARGWSQADAIRALRAHSRERLPTDSTLLRNWKRWEAGGTEPDPFYKTLIAKTFGTVTAAFFPPQTSHDADRALFAGTGMETLEILARVRASDVSPSTLDALTVTADRLCCEYPYIPSEQLHTEGQAWLRRLTSMMDRRLTLSQHREVLTLAGWVALLVGCLEYDMGDRRTAEGTRRAALSLGEEAGNSAVVAWTHEMRAWFALTQGDYRGAIAAAEAGEEMATSDGAAVQLAAQRAKAWARLGDRRQVETALDQGRRLLESLPYPADVDHHFMVDPAKFDFYAMDCYRIVGENRLANMYAQEVISSSTDPHGIPRKPMRIAEAWVTLGVTAARDGDVEAAVSHGRQALEGDRKSLPSLLMCSRELADTLASHYPDKGEVASYLDEVRALTMASR
ncbi:XRE family transcriptional regulator [Verrucosispora sp. NA02020]|uniref:XRE family transcriptional regulator n=1 Tax=Verrucosispora sp. NA02020 TaxID=2742132 RepID=UPI0020CA3AD3|nr:XRE family transcriptional regulator [Verrucosispora sp. NA02020]